MNALLIVEDDEKLANYLIDKLSKRGFQCEHTTSGVNGIQMIINNQYDIAVIDILLPELSGKKLIEQMHKWKMKTPIIVITGVNDSNLKQKLLEQGVDAYLEKPFDFEELDQAIERIIKK